MLLFHSPHVNHDLPAGPADPRQLSQRVRPPLRRGKMVDDRDGDDGVEAVVAIRQTDVIAGHHLVVAIARDVDKLHAAVAAHLVDLVVDAQVLAIATT